MSQVGGSKNRDAPADAPESGRLERVARPGERPADRPGVLPLVEN
jgi:hypothetical protein